MTENQPNTIPIESEEKLKQVWPSPTDNIVRIPTERLHDSGFSSSIGGILIALVVAVFGGAGLGACYGAIIALSAEKYLNIGLAFSVPFWMDIPAQIGFLWGHLQDNKWRKRISRVGFVVCFYSICVGWVAGVLDGPGIVLNPITLFNHLSDVSLYGLWVIDMKLTKDLHPLAIYLLTLRFGELLWIFQGGLLSGGIAPIYPYCQDCKKWMDNDASIRFQYDPPSTAEAHRLASELVAGNYDTLLDFNHIVKPDQKGLQVNVYRCDACKDHHALDVMWYRPTPDPDKKEIEQMFESGTGTKLVSRLIVPSEIHTHIATLSELQKEELAKAA